MSELRLFLSVDISGSTSLKNLRNHNKLLNVYEDREKFLNDIISNKQIDKKDDLAIKDIILSALARKNSEDDLDWSIIIQKCFNDFHEVFQKYLIDKKIHGSNSIESDIIYPWKSLGDELIYSFAISSYEDLQTYFLSFLCCIRKLDKYFSEEKKLIRLKGSAWVAGFPVKNRKVKLPMPDLNFKDDQGKEVSFPYPTYDYWGPDMDIGFRIGKSTYPGFITTSMDLAQLLANVSSNDQIQLQIVGYEILKGVWFDKPYPIIWAYLPDKILTSNEEFQYQEFEEGSYLYSKFLKEWVDNKKDLKEAKSLISKFVENRNKLPNDLGAIEPYIPNKSEIPKDHLRILEIIREIDNIKEKENSQFYEISKDEEQIDVDEPFNKLTKKSE